MRKLALLVVILWLGTTGAAAQYRKFRFEDEICAYKGVYDARLYTKRQLEGAYRLWFTRDFEMDLYKFRIDSVVDIEKVPTAAEVDYEYGLKAANLRSLAVVDTPFWKDLKARKLKKLEEDYKLARLLALAFEKPSALGSAALTDACAQRFAPPLIAGGSRLLAFYGELLKAPVNGQALSEGERNYIEGALASPDWFREAQVEIISRHWLDCDHAPNKGDDPDGAARKNFRKLFKRVEKGGCDYA